jgi:hypothetical protein
VVALLLVACSGAPTPDLPADALHALPEVVEVPVPVPEFGPGTVESAVASDGRGGWLFAPGDLRRSALVLVDSSGRSEREIGGYGEGPGEMAASFPLWADDTVVIGHDLATRRVIVWGRDGQVRREFRPELPVVPFGRGPGNTLLAMRTDGREELPALVSLHDGTVRTVVGAGDTILASLFTGLDSPSERLASTAAIGRWRDGVVVGNPDHYALALFHGDGTPAGVIRRELPPNTTGADATARELARLEQTPMGGNAAAMARARARLEEAEPPRFSHVGAPRSDGRGRLWVVVQEGDAVAADVFADTTWLGRVPLDCPGFGGRWDLQGAWLVLVCAPDDPEAMLDAVVRRYHLHDAPSRDH